MSERQIDKAIDDAVRDLMNVDAGPAFRSRVAARLHERPRHFPGWRQLAVAAAAVAAVVIAVVLFRDGGAPPARQALVAPVASDNPAKPTPAIEPVASVRRPPLPSGRVATRRVAPKLPSTARNVTQEIPRASLLATVADGGNAGAEPAGSFRPIEVQPITAPAIRPSQLEITPLAPISQIVITPLDPRVQRN